MTFYDQIRRESGAVARLIARTDKAFIASSEHALALEELAEPTCLRTDAFAGAVRGMLSKA